MKIEQKRLEEQQEIERQKVEEVRIAKIKAKTFACKRCSTKYFNNIKLHEHVRNHHAKKSKFAISSVATSFFTFSQSIIVLSFISFSFTFSHSIVFLFDISNFVITSKFQQTIIILSNISSFTFFHSIISSFRTSKRIISSKFSSIATKFSFLSNSASKFVSQHSKSASSISSYKLVAMRSTFLFNSIFKTFSKSHFIIENLHRMFVEKNMKTKLFVNQNNFFSSNVFALRQARIIFYFLFVFKLSKSTTFEIFTSMHVSMKQSIRASSSRSSFRSSFYSFSTFFFSTIFYFSFVC